MFTEVVLGVALSVAALACGGKHKQVVHPDDSADHAATDAGSGSKAPRPSDMTATSSTGDDLSWLAPIYFEFDSSDLTAASRDTLSKLDAWLDAHPKTSLAIEGHCDEQGTTEYNIALGQRRAEAITQYLERLGIANNRLSAISYGAEHPVAYGHDESAWSKNRRGELRVQR